MKWIDNRWIELACRFLVGGVFIYASLDKIQHPAAFAAVVYNYQLLPLPASNLLAMSLPWLELLVGLALVMGVWRAESALIVTGLLLVFIGAISINLFRGSEIDCGCFSISSGGRGIGILTVLEDIVLLFPGLVVLRRAVSEQRNERSASS